MFDFITIFTEKTSKGSWITDRSLLMMYVQVNEQINIPSSSSTAMKALADDWKTFLNISAQDTFRCVKKKINEIIAI